jgi:hypothetical protein
MGTSFTKLTFSHKVPFIINALFPPLRETQYAGSVKLFAEASELFKHAVFQFIVVGKTASSECILPGGQKDGIRRVLNRDCKEDEEEQIQGAESCG